MDLNVFFRLFICTVFFEHVHSGEDNNILPKPIYQLNNCFTYKPNSRIKIDEEHIVETTDSIEFKEGILFMGCKLTTSNSDLATIEKNQPGSIFEYPINYYENECAKLPIASAIVQAKLYGYKGGEGVVQVAQRHGQFPSFMAVLDQLDPNKTYRILYTRDNIKECFKEKVADLKKLERITSVTSDSNGMAVQPWIDIPWFELLSGNIVDSTVLLVDTQMETVFDCGHFEVKEDNGEINRIRNNTMKKYTSILLLFVLLLVVIDF